MFKTQQPPLPHSGYETRDAHIAPVVKFLVWLFFSVGLVLFAMYGLIQLYKQMPIPNSDIALHPLAAERQVPGEPRLEALRGVHKSVDGEIADDALEPYFNRKMFKDWNADWQAELSSYGWVDQAGKIAHVPVERAMQLKLEKGFPTAKPGN